MRILPRRFLTLPAPPRQALCGECFAVIALAYLEKHYAWHDSINNH